MFIQIVLLAVCLKKKNNYKNMFIRQHSMADVQIQSNSNKLK